MTRGSKTAMQRVQVEVLREDLHKKEPGEDALLLLNDLERDVGAFLERRCTCIVDSCVAKGSKRK